MNPFSAHPAGSPWPAPFGLDLEVGPSHPCPYFPGRESSVQAFLCPSMSGAAHQRFLDTGFRRSGRLLYRPACADCRECVPLRVPLASFRPSRSQRRSLRRNADVRVDVGTPALTDEKHALYARYLAARHNGLQSSDREDLRDFLYAPVTETVEMTYRDAEGRLLGVGLCDLTPVALSAVYFYFDPAPEVARRSPGTFSALREIELARTLGRSHYYLGFYVAGCGAMSYKNRFRPCERLDPDGAWRPFGPAE